MSRYRTIFGSLLLIGLLLFTVGAAAAKGGGGGGKAAALGTARPRAPSAHPTPW